jgi:hypothetical protein
METLSHINPDWLIYVGDEKNFFDLRNFKRLKKGSCVGLNIPYGKKGVKILFKHVFTSNEDPSTLHKTFTQSQKLNIKEGITPTPEDDIDYFLKPEASLNLPPINPPSYIELQTQIKDE